MSEKISNFAPDFMVIKCAVQKTSNCTRFYSDKMRGAKNFKLHPILK